jgi:hypothetical protein
MLSGRGLECQSRSCLTCAYMPVRKPVLREYSVRAPRCRFCGPSQSGSLSLHARLSPLLGETLANQPRHRKANIAAVYRQVMLFAADRFSVACTTNAGWGKWPHDTRTESLRSTGLLRRPPSRPPRSPLPGYRRCSPNRPAERQARPCRSMAGPGRQVGFPQVEVRPPAGIARPGAAPTPLPA